MSTHAHCDGPGCDRTEELGDDGRVSRPAGWFALTYNESERSHIIWFREEKVYCSRLCLVKDQQAQMGSDARARAFAEVEGRSSP